MTRRRVAVPVLCFALLFSTNKILRLGTVVYAAPIRQTVVDASAWRLSGEYTDTADPDTPISFYVEDGKLVVESERMVPTALNQNSPTEFGVPQTKMALKFTLDCRGSRSDCSLYERSGRDLQAHRRAGSPRLSRLPAQRSDDSDARWGEAAHGDSEADRHRDAAAVSCSAHALRRATEPVVAHFSADGRNWRASGYIYVCEDIRGRFKSEGQFVMSRPLADHHDPKAVDESTDTYDTVDWLLKNVQGNNGRAGFVGTSYPGFLAMMAGIDPHPAVKAISPQAPMIDVWMGDDFFHNGAFRQTYGYDYVYRNGVQQGTDGSELRQGQGRQDRRRIRLLSGARIVQRGCEEVGRRRMLPTWKLFLDHPSYDRSGRRAAWSIISNTVAVPTLSVGGYYDQEDMWGPQEEYKSAGAARRQSRELSGAGAVAAWIVGIVVAASGQSELWRVDRQGVSRAD